MIPSINPADGFIDGISFGRLFENLNFKMCASSGESRKLYKGESRTAIGFNVGERDNKVNICVKYGL